MQWNGASRCEFDGKSVETETTTWSEFPNGGKAIVEQIPALEEMNKPRRAELWESQSGIQTGKFTIWGRSFELEKIQQNSPGWSFAPEWVSHYLWTLKFPKRKTLEMGW